MKIGILGTGDVGQALGHGFLRLGHEVKMGSREAGGEKARAWVAKMGKGASEGTFADAASFGALAVLATLWSGTENAISFGGTRQSRRQDRHRRDQSLDLFTRQCPAGTGAGTDRLGGRAGPALDSSRGPRQSRAFNMSGTPISSTPTSPTDRPT